MQADYSSVFFCFHYFRMTCIRLYMFGCICFQICCIGRLVFLCWQSLPLIRHLFVCMNGTYRVDRIDRVNTKLRSLWKHSGESSGNDSIRTRIEFPLQSNKANRSALGKHPRPYAYEAHALPTELRRRWQVANALTAVKSSEAISNKTRKYQIRLR
jgi:hypothetical protein